MGDVISMDGEQMSSSEAFAISEFMEDIFDVCDQSGLKPETVCYLMINTFSKSAFKYLCAEHAWPFVIDAIKSAEEAVSDEDD